MARKPSMCPKCGNLVGSDDSQCVSCGLQMGSTMHGVVSARGLFQRWGTTKVLLVAILVVYGVMVLAQGKLFAHKSDSFFSSLLTGGFFNRTLWMCGVQHPWLVFEKGECWRLVTAMFMHGGVGHLAMNAWVLSQLGRFCEHYFDARRTFVIFFVSGLVGFLASGLYGNSSLGASGAVLGLGTAVMVKARWSGGGFDRMIYSQLFGWMIFIVILGFMLSGMIDWVGHLGGMVAGAVVGRVLLSEGGIRARVHRVAFTFCVLMTLFCAAVQVVYYFQWPPGHVYRELHPADIRVLLTPEELKTYRPDLVE